MGWFWPRDLQVKFTYRAFFWSRRFDLCFRRNFSVNNFSVNNVPVVTDSSTLFVIADNRFACRRMEAACMCCGKETAAMRSQANTAKLLEASPTLMRMRELEVLEKVASSSNLQVLLGSDGGLTDRLTKLI